MSSTSRPPTHPCARVYIELHTNVSRGSLVWSGNDGEVFFYQSELPYGVTQDQYRASAGYRVAENVTSHKGYGVGEWKKREWEL